MQVEMYNGLDLCLMTPELNHFEFPPPPTDYDPLGIYPLELSGSFC